MRVVLSDRRPRGISSLEAMRQSLQVG